ncbi:MAG: hypothetical protein P8X47_06920 [Ignavibacteriaceae bacterium]
MISGLKTLIITILFITTTSSLYGFNSFSGDSTEAGDEIYDGKAQLTFGWFLPTINSSAQLNTKFRFKGLYRFNNKHSVEGYYYALNRSGANISSDSIVFGDLVINLNSSFTSFFKATLFGGKYRYSVYNDSNVETGFSAGISFLYVDIGATVLLLDRSIANEEYSELLFLPVFGFYNRVNLSDNLIFRSNVDAFALNIEKYDGILLDLSIAVEYYFLQRFSVGTSYNVFALDIKFDTNEKGEIKYGHRGFMFFGKVYF